LIQKFATEKRESFMQYEATAVAGKDIAGYKALSYSSLLERRFVTSVRDGTEKLHKILLGLDMLKEIHAKMTDSRHLHLKKKTRVLSNTKHK
jgi:hypothetical protein